MTGTVCTWKEWIISELVTHLRKQVYIMENISKTTILPYVYGNNFKFVHSSTNKYVMCKEENKRAKQRNYEINVNENYLHELRKYMKIKKSLN